MQMPETAKASEPGSFDRSSVDVSIEGQVYTIRSELSSTQVTHLAEFVDGMMREIRTKTPTIAPTRVAILAALNIAEELFRVREQCALAAQRTGELVELIEQMCTPKAES